MIGAAVHALVEDALGAPVTIEPLKVKPGRRTTARATGVRGSAIVKVYASQRAPVVAARVRAVAGGPAEPEVPRVVMLSEEHHVVMLSDVPGVPLTAALLAGDIATCAQAGRALGTWHRAFEGQLPDALRPHTSDRENEILERWAGRAEPAVGRRVRAAAEGLLTPWTPRVVVHRDLYEEQILVGERIGLIDLDDCALGPPELDLGNLLAHLVLLQRASNTDLRAAADALMEGYRAAGATLDADLLSRLRRASLLRLACIHERPDLITA